MASYRYFKPEEFVACNPPCSIDDMNEDFMRRLDDARSLCSYQFKLNSAFRSIDWERAQGRHFDGNGSHSKGVAVDISCLTSRARLQMLLSLLAVGFRRIGIYPTFLHVDSDTSKSPAIWCGR